MEVKKIKSFKELKIWQKGIEIVEDIYTLTKFFPADEKYGLTSQMRRSAVSIPSNIAEGFKRYHNREYKQFLYITLGSTAELETQLILSNKLNYLSKNIMAPLSDKIDHLSKMITLLMKKLT